MTRSLGEELGELEGRASPGPWRVVRSDAEHGRALIHGRFIEVHVDKRQRMEDPTSDAALIVLLRNNLPRIRAALDLAGAVEAPLGKDRSWTLSGQDILRDPEGTKVATERFWAALARYRASEGKGG